MGRLGGFELKAQVGVVEGRDHVAGLHGGADLGRAGEELAADAEAEVGLGPRADRPGKSSRGRRAVEPRRGDHDHLRGRLGCGGFGRGSRRGEP